jgi:hypothetical protein
VQELLPVLADDNIFVHLNSLIRLLDDLFKDFFLALFLLENFSDQVLGIKASRNEQIMLF